jgi:hypothetical protein
VRALLFALVALSSASCTDPCVALAERICQCQLDPTERLACRQERVTNQKDQRPIDDDDRTQCTAALDTCDCADLDENRTDECGFAYEAAPPEPAE